jgi:hypothetical protein
LLLLHGFGADKSNWVRVAKCLTPHFTVVADHDRLVDVSGAQVLKAVMPNAEVGDGERRPRADDRETRRKRRRIRRVS